MYENSGTFLEALRGGQGQGHSVIMKPFSLHEERAHVGLRDAAIESSLATVDSALSKFRRVNEQASPSLESQLRYLSQDQSIKRATRQQNPDYDFCAEILDSARGPYSMDCIQKEFLRLGGKKEGTLFPSVASMPLWNSQPSWLDIKKILERVKSETASKDRAIQERASVEFYGPFKLEHSHDIKTKTLGVEIFWFNQPNVFIGRRIRHTLPNMKETGGSRQISFVYFTRLSITKPTETKISVISDGRFGVELNRPLGNQYTLGTTVNSANSLVFLPHERFPLTKFTTDAKWSLDKSLLSGYWSQSGPGRHFKLEPEIDPNDLCLTQDPYAPMISFQVYRDPQDFGADFNFADKRLSLMMKWGPLSGTPGWVYRNVKIPFVKFRRDSSMKLQSSFKMYSFITMTILMRFNSLPNNFVNMEEYIALPGQLGKIALRVIGNGTSGQGVLQLYCESETPRTTTVATVRQGVPYLIVLRIHRTNEYDIYSVNGISVGAQELAVLQENPSTIEYAPLLFSDPSTFSNPNTRESRSMVIGNGDIDIMWVRMYDYLLNSKGIDDDMKHLNL